MKSNKRPSLTLVAAALALACGSMGTAQAAAKIVINNLNAPGIGFNETTPATPIGGNTGTTIGQQRLIAFTHAANIWGKTLTSDVPIVINAPFEPLSWAGGARGVGGAGQQGGLRGGAPVVTAGARGGSTGVGGIWTWGCATEDSGTTRP